VKATEGVDFVDARFNANMTNAAAAGILVGPYHFCRIDSKNGVPFTSYDGSPFAPGSDPYLDATSEASDFLEAIMPYYQKGLYLPPVADVEGLPNFGSASLNKTFISNWVQLFSDTINAAIGRRPIIYTSKSKANEIYTASVAAQHDLWVAWWKGTGTTSPPVHADTPLFPNWKFWQWSATEAIAGVPAGQTDADVFYGTTQQLTQLLIGQLPGDYNDDGTVNAADYVVWRNTNGQSGANLAADGDRNGTVNSADFTYWRSRFGQTAASYAGAASSSFAIAPEPAAIVLGIASLFSGLCVRRPRQA
jgi:GH25 family lysozyme M1 (1,4-beta-N-acetylmuramidase)